MDLREILKSRRTEHNLTQEQLAEQLFVSKKTISNWETGRTLPDIDSLVRIAKFFNLSLDSILLEGSDIMKDLHKVFTGRALGDTVRSLKNPLTEQYLELEAAGADSTVLHALTDGSLARAIAGDVDNGTLVAGQISGKLTRLQSVAAIVDQLFPQG